MMFVACGLNYKTAPLDIREKIAATGQDNLLKNLTNSTTVKEVTVLSTCNRTEFYYYNQNSTSISTFLAHQYNLPELIPYFYNYYNHEGIRHALRVASGLDSMMLGEPQIFGQMKQAYLKACNAGTVKTNLHHIFQYIFRTSKSIRKHSGINNNAISIAYGASQLIGKLFPNYDNLKVLLIGSGDTATLVAKYLHKHGVKNFTIASRTTQNAQELANLFNGKILPITDLANYLANVDVVISATACPITFVNKPMVQNALRQKTHGPMVFLDLAIPRDIADDIKDMENVYLYNIDDLHTMNEKGLARRQNAAKNAERLIDMELDNYFRINRTLNANKIIYQYRKLMHNFSETELKRAKAKIKAGYSYNDILQELSSRLVNKMIHNPTLALRSAAEKGQKELLELANYLNIIN